MNKTKVWMGIDVGGSGAIAITDGKMILEIIANKETDTDLSDFIAMVIEKYDVVSCVMEKVHSMPKQGVSSSFKFGESSGFLRGIVVAHKLRWEYVTPQKWMSIMGVPKRGEKSKTEHKNLLKTMAQRIYPHLKITLVTADAILLSHYCFKLYQNQ